MWYKRLKIYGRDQFWSTKNCNLESLKKKTCKVHTAAQFLSQRQSACNSQNPNLLSAVSELRPGGNNLGSLKISKLFLARFNLTSGSNLSPFSPSLCFSSASNFLSLPPKQRGIFANNSTAHSKIKQKFQYIVRTCFLVRESFYFTCATYTDHRHTCICGV